MILTLFILLNVIALTILLYGYYTQTDAYKYLAFTIFFLLGWVFLLDNLQTTTGQTITVVGNVSTYVDTYTPVLTSTSIVGTLTYRIFAMMYLLFSVIGYLQVSLERRSSKRKTND